MSEMLTSVEKIDKWYCRLMLKCEKDRDFFSDKAGKKMWKCIHNTDKGYNARLRYLYREG